jgi:hypothetical protein
MVINLNTDIPTATVDGKEVAKIDNTDINDVKVILTDRSTKYIQRFFVRAELKELVQRAQLMRATGIESL